MASEIIGSTFGASTGPVLGLRVFIYTQTKLTEVFLQYLRQISLTILAANIILLLGGNANVEITYRFRSLRKLR